MFEDSVEGYAEGEEPLVFYHKRGEFRKNESQECSDLATGVTKPAGGLFKSLVSTKGNRFMLFAVAMSFVLVLGVHMLAKVPNAASLNGVACELSASSFDGTVYVSLKLSVPSSRRAKGELPAPFMVNAALSFLDAEGKSTGSQELSLVYDSQYTEPQFLRTTVLDGGVKKVLCKITGGGSETELTASVIER